MVGFISTEICAHHRGHQPQVQERCGRRWRWWAWAAYQVHSQTGGGCYYSPRSITVPSWGWSLISLLPWINRNKGTYHFLALRCVLQWNWGLSQITLLSSLLLVVAVVLSVTRQLCYESVCKNIEKQYKYKSWICSRMLNAFISVAAWCQRCMKSGDVKVTWFFLRENWLQFQPCVSPVLFYIFQTAASASTSSINMPLADEVKSSDNGCCTIF